MRISAIVISLLIIVALCNTPVYSQNQQRGKDPQERLAMQYFRNKEYDKSAEIYEKLFKKTQNISYYTYLYQSYLELKEYNKAIRIVKKMVKRNPTYYRYQIDLGYAYSLDNRPQQADQVFNHVINNMPANQNQVKQIATTFSIRRLNDYTIKTYLKGRELLYNEYRFYIELGDIYARTGNYEEMVNEYLDELGFHPALASRLQTKFQNIIQQTEGEILTVLREQLLTRIQATPDNRIYPEFLIWLSIQEKDFEMALLQARSLDRRFRENGQLVFNVAMMGLSNADYESSLEGFDYVMRKGKDSPLYIPARIGSLEAAFKQLTVNTVPDDKELKKLSKAFESSIEELGKSHLTVKLVKNYAHLVAFYLHDTEYAAEILYEMIPVPNVPAPEIAQCKLLLADILLFRGEIWDASLLYSQVEKDFKYDEIGHEAKLRNARLTYYAGEFEWAKTQADVLKAATAKLIANDAMALSLLISDNTNTDSTTAELNAYARADLFSYQNRYDEAIILLDSLQESAGYHPIQDEILYKKAMIFKTTGRYEDAAIQLENLYTSFPTFILADDAIYELALIYELHLDNTERAMELYQKIMKDFPGSVFTVDARKRFRKLRGDI